MIILIGAGRKEEDVPTQIVLIYALKYNAIG